MPSKVQDEITYLLPNINGGEWISNSIPHFIMCIITYPLLDLV